MKKKNKAAKAVNTALGLIVILAVILCSPLFGYARGFAAPGQRQAADVQSDTGTEQTFGAARAAATPRPTAQPTPTPVVLPSAPPAPSPTPVPTPKPVPVQQPVQQAAQPVQQAQQTWQEEAWWEGEEGYEEEGGEEYVETPPESYDYEGLGEQAENGVIATENADIVINTDMGGNDAGGYIEPAPEPVVEPAVDYAEPIQPDRSEGEAFVFG